MARTQPLRAQLVVDLAPYVMAWSAPHAIGIGHDAAVYAVARRSTEARADATVPRSRLESPSDYLIVRWHEGHARHARVRGEHLDVSYVQPMPGGVLLAGARCHWRPGGAERNALVSDWGGRVTARLTLGDGIADLRTTRDGTIWASYFDEGVFGNFGWNGPGPQGPGAAGLVAFAPTGDIVARYDPDAAGTDDIVDAYALNVGDDGDVWLYFYAEFPIVRIRGGAYQVWRPYVAGAQALAVRGERVLLAGRYGRADIASIFELGRGRRAKLVRTVALVDDGGARLTDARLAGVGDRLYAFVDGRVLRFDAW